LLTILQEKDESLHKAALEAVKDSIKTSTSSMTAVPKPLKFLRPHYHDMEKTFESWPSGDNKVRLGSTSISVKILIMVVRTPWPMYCQFSA